MAPETTDAATAETEAATETHETREECVEAEAWLKPHDGEAEKRSYEYDDGHAVVYDCPVCGRTYEYLYAYEGVYDTEANRYVTLSEAGDREEWDDEAAYYDDVIYSVPDTDEGRYERVYILSSLQHAESGDIVSSF